MNNENGIVRRLRAHRDVMLEKQNDISVSELAQSFVDANEEYVDTICKGLGFQYIKRLAREVLSERTAILNQNEPSMQLPLGFGDVRVPAAISYISMANQERHCLTRKADWYKLESHQFIMHKMHRDLGASVDDFDVFMKLVQPVMHDDPEVTVEDALKILGRRRPHQGDDIQPSA